MSIGKESDVEMCAQTKLRSVGTCEHEYIELDEADARILSISSLGNDAYQPSDMSSVWRSPSNWG